jgi:hypothetical protein
VAGTAKETSPPAPAAAAPPLVFENVRVLTVESDGRGRERGGILQLSGDQLAVLDRTGGATLTTLPFSAVVSAHYSRSRQPKWRDANGKEVESKVDLGRLGFLRSERNWLILITSGEPLVLRLEDATLQTTLAAVQDRIGVKIQR